MLRLTSTICCIPALPETSSALNQYMALFTEGGYYRRLSSYNREAPFDEFEKELKTEYASLLERRADFLKEHSPGAEVEEYTADLLLIDYYTALFGNAISQAADGKDVSGYKALLPELDLSFMGNRLFPVCFSLAANVYIFLYFEHTRRVKK